MADSTPTHNPNKIMYKGFDVTSCRSNTPITVVKMINADMPIRMHLFAPNFYTLCPNIPRVKARVNKTIMSIRPSMFRKIVPKKSIL